MGSEGSTQSSSVPSKVEDHTTKPEGTNEGQLPPNSVQVFPNDAGAKYSAINPVTLAPGAVNPHQIPPMSLSFYADEEVDESRELPNPARELAEAQIASLAELTDPGDKERMDADAEPEEEGNEEDHGWSGALDLPKSAENETVLPHKGDKPNKEMSLKEGKPWLALKPRRPQE